MHILLRNAVPVLPRQKSGFVFPNGMMMLQMNDVVCLQFVENLSPVWRAAS